MNAKTFEAKLRQLTEVVNAVKNSGSQEQLDQLKEHLWSLERSAGSAAFNLSIRTTFGAANSPIPMPVIEAQSLARAA